MMKKILILTASTGEGHNQAAKTLEKEFNNKGYICKIVDMFKSTNRSMDVIMSDGYKILASNMPKMYGTLYRKADDERFNRLVVKKMLKITEIKLRKIVRDFAPDAIIATHPFAVSIVGNLKVKKKITIPFIQVVTDFRAHYAYVDDNVDAYITASEHAKQDLIRRGISSAKVHPFGIPVKREFIKRLNRIEEQKKPFTLLIMGGSMGMKAMESVVESITMNKHSIFMNVVCGNNKSLQNLLAKKFEQQILNGKLEVLGFVNNIPDLMEKSDLIITKPGGLTSSEAINKTIPMLIPFAIPGQEQENTDLLVESGMAIEIKLLKDINHYVNDLIDNPIKCREMAMNMSAFSQGYSINKVVDLVDRIIESQQDRLEDYFRDRIEVKSFDHLQ